MRRGFCTIVLHLYAAVKIQGGKPFIVPIVSGAVGGALISIIVLVLVTLLIINIRRKIRHSSQEVKPNIDITLSKLKPFIYTNYTHVEPQS